MPVNMETNKAVHLFVNLQLLNETLPELLREKDQKLFVGKDKEKARMVCQFVAKTTINLWKSFSEVEEMQFNNSVKALENLIQEILTMSSLDIEIMVRLAQKMKSKEVVDTEEILKEIYNDNLPGNT
jgi:hypothetical protein